MEKDSAGRGQRLGVRSSCLLIYRLTDSGVYNGNWMAVGTAVAGFEAISPNPSPQYPVSHTPPPLEHRRSERNQWMLRLDAKTRIGSLHCLFGSRGRHGTLVLRHLCCLSLTSKATLTLALGSKGSWLSWLSGGDWGPRSIWRETL
jgi:hypothetical protein